MHKKIIIVASLLIFFSVLRAQTLIPYLHNGKYGYSDINGEIVIEPLYYQVELFNKEGFAWVYLESSKIYINKTGKEILTLTNEEKTNISYVTSSIGSRFNRKSAVDTLKDLRKVTFSDKSFQFLNIHTNRKSRLYTPEPQPLYSACPPWFGIQFKHDFFVGETRDNSFEVLNDKGDVILISKTKPIIWNEGLIAYSDGEGIILFNPKRKTKVSIPYRTVHDLVANQYLIVSNNKTSNRIFFGNTKYKRGLVTTKGELIIDTIYQGLTSTHSNRLVCKNDMAILTDNEGNIIKSDHEFKSIYPIKNDKFIAQLVDGKRVIINANADIQTNDSYDELKYHEVENYFTWKNGVYVGILDSNLNQVISYNCESIYFCNDRNYFYITKASKTGIIDTGKNIVVPMDFDRCYFRHDNYIEIYKDDRKGLMNLSGSILFQPEFEEIEVVKNGGQLFFRPKRNGMYACYDEELNQLSEFSSRDYYISNTPLDRYHHDGAYHFTNRYGIPIGYSSKNYFTGYVKSDSTYLLVVLSDDGHQVKDVLINESSLGNQYSEPVQYTKVQIKTGLIGISVGSIQGVVSHQNEAIIPLGKREIIEITDKFIVSKEQYKFFLYDLSGQLIYKKGFDFVSDSATKGFRAVANKIDGKTYEHIRSECLNGKDDTIIRNHMNYGYINSKAEIVIPLMYQKTFRYCDNLVPVSKGLNEGEKQSFLLDTLGRLVLSTRYDELYPLNHTDESRHYVATLNGKKGLINLEGDVLIPFEYKWIQGFYKLVIFKVQDVNGSWHLVNMSNKLLYTSENYRNEKIYEDCIELPNQKYLIFPNGESVVIDVDGNVLYRFPEHNVNLTKIDNTELIEVIGDEHKYYINANTVKAYTTSD